MTDFIFKVRSADLFRMVGWLACGLALYGASMYVGAAYPQAQVILQKLGNVTMFSWVGYWISRRALGRLDLEFIREEPMKFVARAIVISSCVLAGAIGL